MWWMLVTQWRERQRERERERVREWVSVCVCVFREPLSPSLTHSACSRIRSQELLASLCEYDPLSDISASTRACRLSVRPLPPPQTARPRLAAPLRRRELAGDRGATFTAFWLTLTGQPWDCPDDRLERMLLPVSESVGDPVIQDCLTARMWFMFNHELRGARSIFHSLTLDLWILITADKR